MGDDKLVRLRVRTPDVAVELVALEVDVACERLVRTAETETESPRLVVQQTGDAGLRLAARFVGNELET